MTSTLLPERPLSTASAVKPQAGSSVSGATCWSRPTIRPATATDLPLLAALEQAAAQRFDPQDLSAPQRSQTLPSDVLQAAAESGLAWVAEETTGTSAGTPVGFLVAEDTQEGLHIQEMGVLPSHGRAGTGGALLQAAVDHARRAGHPMLTLTTFAHVPWNAPFYAQRGFHALATKDCPPALRRRLAQEEAGGLRNRVAMARPVA